MPPNHIALLQMNAVPITTIEGSVVSIWNLLTPANNAILSSWSKHFREHYCLDNEIDMLRQGTGLTRRDYLMSLVFPDSAERPGPSVRTGDFTEILVSDYLEFILGYNVPRIKFSGKAVRNEPVKGVDVIGFTQADQNNPDPSDTLITFEVKAKLTGRSYDDTLQKAIDDSSKDFLRLAETLNATKRRYYAEGKNESALQIERFQNKSDNPYLYKSGAAAIVTSDTYDAAAISHNTTTVNHLNNDMLSLLVIRGDDLMNLVHTLYQSAADDA